MLELWLMRHKAAAEGVLTAANKWSCLSVFQEADMLENNAQL